MICGKSRRCLTPHSGPGRFALSAYRLRDGVEPVSELSLLARDEFGTLCGSIRYWPVLIADDAALLLGPIAVHPTRQGEGLGGKLMRESIQRAACLGWQNIVLVGDEPYYRRFGFLRKPVNNFPASDRSRTHSAVAARREIQKNHQGPGAETA